MREMVYCGGCGIRYDGRHAKCPRCRSRVRRPPQPAVEAVPRRALPVHVVAVLALAVVGTPAAFIWAVHPRDVAPAAQQPQGRGLLAAIVSADRPARPIVEDRVPGEVPFLDSAAEGRQAYQRGEYDLALERFKDEIALHPTDASAHSNAGQVLVRLGRPAEAFPYLAKAVALDPNRWTYRFNLARGYAAVGDWGLAAAEYEEASRFFPDDYATLFNLAQSLHRAGREDEAVARYRQAIELKPDDASFQLALAISEEKRGEVAEAVAAYRRFLEMAPDAQEAAGVRARVERLEKTETAVISSQ